MNKNSNIKLLEEYKGVLFLFSIFYYFIEIANSTKTLLQLSRLNFMDIKTCPFCNGEMVKGKSKADGYARYFWKKPWSGIFSRSLRAYPWLCLNCGAVIPYIENQELKKIKIEFERQKIGGL